MSFYQVWFWASVWLAVAGLNLWWFWAAKRTEHVCEIFLTDEQMQTLVGRYLESGGGIDVTVLANPWDASVQARADQLVEELIVESKFNEIIGRLDE